MIVIQQIILGSQWWLVLICMLAGLLYALALYYREQRYEFSQSRKLVMGVVRAVAVAFISFFLLSPLFLTTTRQVEEPVIIIAQDHSASVLARSDSLFYLNEYPLMLNSLIQELGQSNEVRSYSFGETLREGIDFEYTDRQTNIAEVLTETRSRYLNRNVGALIIASDGIYNQGIHPLYALEYLPFPVYIIALGDTTPVRDAAIVNVAHNRIAYLDNIFPIEVHVRGTLCDGLNTTLRVSKDGELLFSERIVFTGNNDNRFIPFELLAAEPGMQRYRVEVLPVEGESITANNVRDIFVEVLEARQKVLILYGSPHPDVSAIRQTLESKQNYQVEVHYATEYSGNLQEYSLVILHQVPARRQSHTTLLRTLNESDLPVLHILGSNSDINVFNTLGTGFSISGAGNRLDETLPALNNAFTLFTLSDEFRETLRFFPPLFSPYGDYRESLSSNVLFYRQIGTVVTETPLISFADISGKKAGLIAGEGIWRWRMANFARRGDHNAFDEWLTKSIQYLALREQKERFMVHTENSWFENDLIEFSAEFYNESFEPVNTPDVELVITDEAEKQYPYAFSRTGNAYGLQVGSLSPGNYRYNATLQWEDQTFEAAGTFSVIPLQKELINTIADHRLLYGLANRFGGEMFMVGEMDKIAELINQRDDVRPLFYLEKSYFELIEIWWLMALILGLLATEWVLRRVAGGY